MKNQIKKPKSIPMDCFVNKIEGGITTLCLASQISPESMTISAIGGPENTVHKEIAIEMRLPDSSEVLLITGKTVNKNDNTIEVNFTEINNRHKALLQGFYARELQFTELCG